MRITIDAILSWRPCQEPIRYDRAYLKLLFGRRESVTAADVLRCRRVPADDRLWVVLRENVLPAAVLREFAAGCAYRALERHGGKLTADQMDACLWACDVAAAIAVGADIPDEERAAAWDAAGDAAWAAGAAARAAWDAAGDAAWAAGAAAWVAGAAAWAAGAAARAAGAAAWAAGAAARAARDAEAEAQCGYLLSLLAGEGG